jgi:succinate dehydrogenase/fumarate reductase cytochrome b subunit
MAYIVQVNNVFVVPLPALLAANASIEICFHGVGLLRGWLWQFGDLVGGERRAHQGKAGWLGFVRHLATPMLARRA